jgi:hypothetical protein
VQKSKELFEKERQVIRKKDREGRKEKERKKENETRKEKKWKCVLPSM